MPDNHIATPIMNENSLGVFAGYAKGRDLKAWPYFAELCTRVRNVLVFGLPTDIQRVHWPKNVSFFSGSLSEIFEKIRHLKVFVGNCAGITNLASVTGIPTIIIYGPTCEIKNRPEGANVIQVFSNDLQCRPCQRKDRKTYLSENCDTRTCLYSIKPGNVVQLIEKFI
jgi:ADP-heptose:LPS heptosyltransferase